MNRKARRAARKAAPQVGDVIHTKILLAKIKDGGFVFFWVQVTEHMTEAECLKQEMHGPFRSAEEAEANSVAVLLGPDCEITEGGEWDPAWSRPQ